VIGGVKIMGMLEPKALIFDCDGTLADTMPLHWRAWQKVAASYGLEFSENRFYELVGVPSRDVFTMLSAEQNRPLDPVRASQEREAAYMQCMQEVRSVEPIEKIVRENAGKLPMAVASGGNQAQINEVLEHIGMRQFFQAVVTSEYVKRQKPFADIFLEAARRLAVEPAYCRAYEDTDIGLQAIRAAGMEAVDVRLLRRSAESTANL
jgi:beta-phosphoglucomutase-like phosphatase (HAD superfamily)